MRLILRFEFENEIENEVDFDTAGEVEFDAGQTSSLHGTTDGYSTNSFHRVVVYKDL